MVGVIVTTSRLIAAKVSDIVVVVVVRTFPLLTVYHH